MLVQLIGEAPARGTVAPFEGRSGKFLRELLDGWMDGMVLCNLFAHPMPRRGKGSTFPISIARALAERYVLYEGAVVLLAGKRVARAFNVQPDYFRPCVLRGHPCYVVPHPSGVNRWWNVEINRARARQFFWALFKMVSENPKGLGIGVQSAAEQDGRIYH